MEVFGALGFLQAIQFEGIVNQAEMAIIYSLCGNQESAAVDLALSGDAYVLLLDAEDERGPVRIGITHIVPGVEGTQQARALFDMEGDIVLDVDGAGNEIVRRDGAAHLQVEVGMGIDEPGEHETAGAVDHLVRRSIDIPAHLDDPLPLREQVSLFHSILKNQRSVFNQNPHIYALLLHVH